MPLDFTSCFTFPPLPPQSTGNWSGPASATATAVQHLPALKRASIPLRFRSSMSVKWASRRLQQSSYFRLFDPAIHLGKLVRPKCAARPRRRIDYPSPKTKPLMWVVDSYPSDGYCILEVSDGSIRCGIYSTRICSPPLPPPAPPPPPPPLRSKWNWINPVVFSLDFPSNSMTSIKVNQRRSCESLSFCRLMDNVLHGID